MERVRDGVRRPRRAVLEAGLYSLCNAIVVELEVLWPGWCLGEGRHGDWFIGGAECWVDAVCRGHKVLGGGHEVELLLVGGVELEVVRHTGVRIWNVVDHGECGWD